MNKVGFLVKNLGASQLGYFLIRNLNEFLDENFEFDCTVYSEERHNGGLTVGFPVMQIIEAWGQQGTIISTSISTACKMIKFPSACRKLFYVWDLEFLRGHVPNNYDLIKKVYLNEDIELIARCENHASVIKNNFNRDVIGIIEDFNMVEIMEMTKNELTN